MENTGNQEKELDKKLELKDLDQGPTQRKKNLIQDELQIKDFLYIYEQSRNVPVEAQKQFNNGRFSGTDINPQWRLKKLTELFGPCGFGWCYEIVEKWIEKGTDGVETSNVQINLFVKIGDLWSRPIPGLGGNTFISKTLKGLVTSDECYKMALTDAISVSAKALGIGADIYFAGDRTKYSQNNQKTTTEENNEESNSIDWWKMN